MPTTQLGNRREHSRDAGGAIRYISSMPLPNLPRRISALLLALGVMLGCAKADETKLERSFWLHASLGLFTQRNYFGPDFPATPMPQQSEVENAARVLTGYAANRLYLIYHRELPIEDARRLFVWWRQACPPEVEIVPALVLRMYDQPQTPVFSPEELTTLVDFFHDEINPDHLAVYDIAPRRDPSAALPTLTRKFSRGLIRVGLQPDEPLDPAFSSAVVDTWSGFCHGTRNVEDWQQPGFGAETLRKWVVEKKREPQSFVWDLIVVAWDYTATERGGYPGYDDAEKNMPLPTGRNRLAAEIIRNTAVPTSLRGFSSDLYILHENSRTSAHDGRKNAFYECLKRGEDYHGIYSAPLHEIVEIYSAAR